MNRFQESSCRCVGRFALACGLVPINSSMLPTARMMLRRSQAVSAFHERLRSHRPIATDAIASLASRTSSTSGLSSPISRKFPPSRTPSAPTSLAHSAMSLRANSSAGAIHIQAQSNESATAAITTASTPEWPDESYRTISNRWQTTTDQLLIAPIGSLDDVQWHLSQLALFYWAEHQTHGIATAFQLLDRMVEEKASASQSNAGRSLHISYVHAILKTWKFVFRKQQQNHSKGPASSPATLLLPSQILSKLDDHQTKCLASPLYTPNVATYSLLLDGAAHAPMPSERIDFSERLLERLIERSATDLSLQPTIVTFSSVINAHAQSGNGAKAEALYDRMMEMRRTDPQRWHASLKPNHIVVSAVINAWAKAGNAVKAQEWLQRMYVESMQDPAMRPNVFVFNTVLSAYSTSQTDLAYQLLRKMTELADTQQLDVRPTVVSYNCVLNCHVRSGDAAAADALWDEMLEQSVIPNEITCTTMIKIIRKSRVGDRRQRMRKVVNYMEQQGIPQNTFIWNALRET